MLFPYRSEISPTPKTIKNQQQALKQFEQQHFNVYEVNQLIANRTRFYDDLLSHLWQFLDLSSQPDLALIAVGGYGREEMFPLSDLDILLLSQDPLNLDTENKIVQLVQFLWDSGFEVGHSVRSLQQCIDEGKKDISIATNLLEARFLAGNMNLFKQLNCFVQQDDFWNKKDFFNAKVQERDERYQRYHNTGYNLEPDLKYNPGGLRDLHLLYWIALRHTGAKNLSQIGETQFLHSNELQQLEESQQFLFRVRFALHLILKRYDNRLLFDRQIKVSEILGFENKGNLGVEKMMKIFFQSLSVISRLTDIIVKHYREHFLTTNYDLFIHQLNDDLELRNNSLCLRQADLLLKRPECILDLFFYLTQFPQAELHSSTLRQLQIALEQLSYPLSELASAREKFLRLFNQPHGIARALLPMHQYGVLNAYLPQWENIAGLMQFDLFHIYTVDEHSLRTMLQLEFFLNQQAIENFPICHRIFSQMQDRTMLYISALFHDIAKGRGGDHAKLGRNDIIQFAQLHGFDQREVDTMGWLVENHLLMSLTAQRRDIHNPEVILNFATEVKNKVRLDLLTCLTVADICATNTTLWNSWKRSLFTSLYQFSIQQFQQGMDLLLDHRGKIEQNRKQAKSLLQQHFPALTTEQIDQIWQAFPAEYFLRNTAKQIAWHTSLLSHQQGNLLVKISNRFSQGGTEIFIYYQDQPNLFHKLVCTIGAKRLSIHDAQILTGESGKVFDSFIVTELDGSLLKFDRRRALEQALIEALQSNKTPNIANLTQGVTRKLQHFKVKTEVRFLQESKFEHTELELITLDKPGLLAQISQIFSQLKLNLLQAKITTIGEKAEDFFILTNQQNQALNATEKEQLSQALLKL